MREKYNYNYSYNRYKTPKPKRKYRLKIILILFLIIGGYFGVNYKLEQDKKAAIKAEVLRIAKLEAEAKQKLIDEKNARISKMKTDINSSIINASIMDVSVSVIDLSDNQIYDFGDSSSFIAASVTKLLTATLYLHEVENGKYTMDKNIGGFSAAYQLKQLIELSDNGAWDSFINILKYKGIETWANEIGVTSYGVNDNSVKTADIAKMLAKLYKNELLNESNTKLLLGHMKNANQKELIVDNLPPSFNVYHKSGWLSDRYHDAAIVDNDKNPYVLVIFTKTKGQYNKQLGNLLFKELTIATNDAFTY